MTIKPSIFDWKVINNELEKFDLLGLENSNQKEYCENPKDLLKSDFSWRLILIIERKVSAILEKLNINTNISSIYKKFVNNLPITKLELESIIKFFKSEEISNQIENFVWKLLFLYWEKNKEFIENYLKNESWNINPRKIIQYILWELETYKYVVDVKNENSIILLGKTREWDYYTYESDWKTWIFIVSNWEIFMLKKLFEKISLLSNGLIFCRVENKSSGITELGSNWFSGLIYDFDWNDFKLMEKMNWTIEAIETPIENYFITSQNLIWYWLTEISKWDTSEDKLWVEINQLLWDTHNNIRFQGNFVIARRNKTENENIFEIYVNTDSWLELAHTTTSDLVIWLRDLWDNYFLVEDSAWKNIYKMDKYNIFNNIDDILIWSYIWNIDKLMKWEPTLIRSKKETWIYIFDKKASKLTKLIDVENGNTNSPEINWDMMIIPNNNWNHIFFYKDWKLYDFKKWYKLIKSDTSSQEYIKKWFFGKKILLKNNINDMFEYLEELVIPFKLNTK